VRTSPTIIGFQTEYFPPDAISNAVLYGELVEHLAGLFDRVDVITASPHYGKEASERDAPRPPGSVRVVPCRPPSWRFRSLLPARFLAELGFSARNTVAALRASRDWDVVLSSTPPLLLGVGALAVARVRRIPLVWWVQDLHPEIAVALGLTSSRNPAFRFLHEIHDRVLRAASVVIVVSDAQRTTLLRAYESVAPERVVVLENPATHADATTTGDPPQGPPVTVSYTGNLGLSQGLDHVLNVADEVRGLPLRFVLHGNGAAEAALKEEAFRRGLDNIEFSPFATDDEYLALLGRSHVLLLSLRPEIDRYSFPSKLWTYLAAGRPIAAWAGRGGPVQRAIEQSGAGVFAAWGDVPAAVRGLTELLSEPRRQQFASAAASFYRSHPTPETHAKQLADLLLEAVGAKP
jgi:colanic acid biosynthesis glycosyl transferase WcaI